MATQLLRRALLLAAGASALLLAACGGGSVDTQFTPDRIVAFGDGMADLGQNGNRYTVNDGSVNNWTLFVANAYGKPLAPSASGGLSYAVGNARVNQHPDAAGNNATPTVAEQVGTFLGGNSFRASDLVIVSAGTSDVIVNAAGVRGGTISTSDAQAAIDAAGRDLAAQVRRIVNAGAEHVAVVGPYNLGRSAWAKETNDTTALDQLSQRFNERLLVDLVDLGDRVLYIDAAFYFNLVTSSPTSYEFSNAANPVCTSVDPGPGIGGGNGQVNSNLCTSGTVLSGVSTDNYVFADRVYPSPHMHRLFGDFALSRLRDRW